MNKLVKTENKPRKEKLKPAIPAAKKQNKAPEHDRPETKRPKETVRRSKPSKPKLQNQTGANPKSKKLNKRRLPADNSLLEEKTSPTNLLELMEKSY